MAYAKAYLETATKIIEQYHGSEPLATYLKKYFASNRKHGSRDRKQITHLCYCFYRLGGALKDIPVSQKIIIGLFLCSTASNALLDEVNASWNQYAELPIEKKVSIVEADLGQSLNIEPEIFPWLDELSNGVDFPAFSKSFFTQPDVFLRLRPGFESSVRSKLRAGDIQFNDLSDNLISINNQAKIKSIELDREAVVQDLNSQRTIETVALAMQELHQPVNAWDCCSGSGGKSLQLLDNYPQTKLTASDSRPSIISNLKKRFSIAGIRNYNTFVKDLQNAPKDSLTFDLVICDAPCTGSGTWSRTPEQLCFFNKKDIDSYIVKQKQILTAAVAHLNRGSFLVYITCSVFSKENEQQVSWLQENHSLKLRSMSLLTGYDKKADTLFAALLQRL